LQENLAKAQGQEAVYAQKQQYRDRASERRLLYGQDDKPKVGGKEGKERREERRRVEGIDW